MILVVDDHRDVAELLVRLLKWKGLEAIAAGSGAEALTALLRIHPESMILDANMPGMDGIAVLKWMRDQGVADVPVLMYSADVRQETARRARELGVADFVVKGTISFDDLIQRVESISSARPH